MKNLIVILISVFTFTVAQGQEKKDRIVETNFEVKGVCGKCKTRIEASAMRTKGVKVAEWDKVTQNLKVVYDSKKVDEKEIHSAVAELGHETSMVPADSSAYVKLPNCCKYNDGAKCGN